MTTASAVDVVVVGRRALYRTALLLVLAASDKVHVVRSVALPAHASWEGAAVALLAFADGSGIAVATADSLRSWTCDHPLPVPSVVAGWDRDPEDLERLIRLTASGQLPLPVGEPSGLSSLTPRELEVLALLAGGWDPTAIAAALHISTHTVRTHVANTIEKLGVHSRLEAVCLARRGGVLAMRAESHP